MVQLLSVTCAALGLLHPQLTSPFDCSDSCRTVRGPQEPAWSRGFYARVCDVSLTLRARVCYAPRSHGAGHLRRDVCRNAIMCICALWRPPCTAAVCKVLPPCCSKVGCQRGSIPLSRLEDSSSDGDGFDPPPVQSKGMSFTPADREGRRGTETGAVARHVYNPTAQCGWSL